METSGLVRGIRFGSLVLIASALAACNYGGDASIPASVSGGTPVSGESPVVSGAQDPNSDPSADHAPQISGVATSTATAGQLYSFQPNATDEDGDVLTFSLAGAPGWMKLNASTGLITGTPTNAEIGAHAGIVLQVSDGKSTVSLAAFTVTVYAAGSAPVGAGTGSVDLVWIPPTENTDGTPLVNLNGYKIYYGNSSKNYTTTITISNPGLTRYVIDSLPPGKYFFSVRATSANGTQSGYSQEASTTIS